MLESINYIGDDEVTTLCELQLKQLIKDVSSVDTLTYCVTIGLYDVLDLLLKDQSTKSSRKVRNIIWATDNYTEFDLCDPHSEMTLESILNVHSMSGIQPRSLKSKEIQKQRTKSKAEVFTPTWIVKKQNDAVDENYQSDDLEIYAGRKWLELTCGEAPYMTTRYDMTSALFINVKNRVGFVDRKLARISNETDNMAEWQRLAILAYKSSYGFEWSGDSLLLARLNLLFTYVDYFIAKWNSFPTMGMLLDIAEIISYNLFQMDGLKYIKPLSESKPKRTKIMNWTTYRMEYFDKGVN